MRGQFGKALSANPNSRNSVGQLSLLLYQPLYGLLCHPQVYERHGLGIGTANLLFFDHVHGFESGDGDPGAPK